MKETSKKVYLIGAGMGNPDTLTLEAQRAIQSSDLLLGAMRLLEPYQNGSFETQPLVLSEDIVAAIRSSAATTVSVLLSGDPGFYSGAATLRQRLDQETVVTLPGISSLNYFTAKLNTPWQDCHLVSAHGRGCDPVSEVQSFCKVFFLTGGKLRIQDMCQQLTAAGYGHLYASAGENLSYPNERILSGSVAELAKEEFADLAVLLVENPTPIPQAPMTPGLLDEDFARGKVPMTKESVRTIAVSKLRVQAHSVIWDVGAGTGSVSIACGLAAWGGQVYAVEHNPEACALIQENVASFGTTNVHLVYGSAPEALLDLPVPDRIFIGGSNGNLIPILQYGMDQNPSARVVVAAVTLETLTSCLSAFYELDITLVDVTQITAAQARSLGDHHLMMGQNPVWIITGEGRT